MTASLDRTHERPAKPAKRIRVVIAETTLLGSQLISGALKRCGNKFQVHALAGDSAEALRALQKYAPDVALISVGLNDGPMTGFNVIQEMRTSQIKTSLVVLVDASNDELVVRAFRAGARGIFCRGTPLKALSKCIRRVHEGQIWASGEHMDLLLQFVANIEPRLTPKKGVMILLTPREQEVACLVAEGMNNRDIAAKLLLREHTVRNYLFHIFEKLGLSSRVELVLCTLSQPDPIHAETHPRG
jgi:two-component system, NarL family, nitrate/nitrite response regulator NarL